MTKPTGKLLFAYDTIRTLEEKVVQLKSDVAIGDQYINNSNTVNQEQADQIKILRQGLIDANSWLSIDADYKGSPLMIKTKRILAATENVS